MLAATLTACSSPSTPDGGDPGTDTARVRIIHLSPDAPAVDVYLNSAHRLASNLSFGKGSAVVTVPAGQGTVQVSAAGTPASQAVATLSGVDLEPDHDYTAFAFGKVATLELNTVEDSTQSLASGNVRLRIIHAADGVGPVNVYQLSATGSPLPLAQALRFGTAATPVDLTPEAFQVGLDVDDDQKPDLSFSIPALTAGQTVNVFAALDATGTPFLLAQLTGATTVRIDSDEAQLRVLHLSPNAPAVEAFIDGKLPADFAAISFTQSTPYERLSAASHRLDVSADGTAAGAVLSAPALMLTGGHKYTAVAIGKVASLQALAIEDDATGLAAANIRVHAIHAAPSVGTVDLYTLAAGSATPAPLLSHVKFGDVSMPLDLPAGAYTLGVDVNADGAPDLYFALPALAAGTLANVFVTEQADGTVFALAQLDGTTTARIDPATSKLRVVHLSRNAPAVDVYANGSKVVTGLAFADTTQTLTVSSGAYDLAVTPTGAGISSAVITTHATALLPGKAYTVVAYADLPNITAEVLEDDMSGIATATDIRLNAVHVAPTVTRGDIFNVTPQGNMLLIANIGFGESRRIPDVPSAAYKIGFDAESNGTIDIAFNLPVLAPGNFANVFVATDAANHVFVLVQTTGAGAIRVDPAP